VSWCNFSAPSTPAVLPSSTNLATYDSSRFTRPFTGSLGGKFWTADACFQINHLGKLLISLNAFQPSSWFLLIHPRGFSWNPRENPWRNILSTVSLIRSLANFLKSVCQRLTVWTNHRASNTHDLIVSGRRAWISPFPRVLNRERSLLAPSLEYCREIFLSTFLRDV